VGKRRNYWVGEWDALCRQLDRGRGDGLEHWKATSSWEGKLLEIKGFGGVVDQKKTLRYIAKGGKRRFGKGRPEARSTHDEERG